MDRKKHEIWALCILIFAVMVLLALLSFQSSDLTLFNASALQRAPENWVGFFGASMAWFLLFLFGIGAYGFPLIGFWFGWSLFRGTPPLPYGWIQAPGFFFLWLCVVSLATLHQPKIHIMHEEILTGGQAGLLLAGFLVKRFSLAGADILLIGAALIAFLLATPFTLQSTYNWLMGLIIRGAKNAWSGLSRWKRKEPPQEKAPIESEPDAETGHEEPRKVIPIRKRLPAVKEEPRAVVEVSLLPIKMPPPKKKAGKEEAVFLPSPLPEPGANGLAKYALPSIELLETYETEIEKPDVRKLEENARVLEEKLADFGVQGKVIAICPGPVITMYEYAPAPGIKISRIVGLSDDLSMALKAISIRVVAPIPGKAAIGIEIPNHHRELVSIRAVLESEPFSASSSPLIIALGHDITGQSIVANLAKMPHLLIAGATGTGKSVCINTILSSLLFRNTPDDLRLLLIDPKRIELSTYEGIPHLIHPVVTDAKMATRALRWAVQEMELRYKLLAEKGVRNIEGYNKALAKEKSKAGDQADTVAEDTLLHHHLPYMVIIIDELADLMMVASREVEESITRLAQMARAAGIHLILATQRPSVDVLTGIIKANIPTRVSFQVSSRVDSRTILDGSGAESLLGSGDMLFLPPGTAKLQRIHGAFISESEVQRLTRFWCNQQLVEDPLRERVNFQDQSSSDAVSEDELDEKYEEAVELVIETRQASISMLQRRLRVGYNRAARMIEMMEQQGIVGESDGVKPREVFGRKTS